jgi:F0F1-type ATP synthase membrane subunit a
MLSLLAASDPLEEVLPHPLFNIGSMVVTNQMLMAVIAAILMLLIFPALFSHAEAGVEAPKGSKNFFEAILEFLRVEVFRPALKEHTDRFVPFLWTVFFFILFSNLLGQIPVNEIATLITRREQTFWGTATGTATTTGALALCAFVFIHLNGILQVARSLMDGTYGHHGHHEEHSSDGTHGREAAQDLEHVRGEALAADVPANFQAMGDPTKHYADDEHVGHHHHTPDEGGLHQHGTGHGPKVNPVLAMLLAVPLYLWNFAPHPFKPSPGASPIGAAIGWTMDVVMWFVLLVLELIGAVIKPFALTIRLFANMIAGHIVLGALILLIPVTAGIAAQIGVGTPVTILSLVIRVLELFVSFLQAYIFTFLVTLFIASAVAPEH